MRLTSIFNILFGFILIILGIWLIKDFIIPFLKVFAGVFLIFVGLGFLFAGSVASHIKYKVR